MKPYIEKPGQYSNKELRGTEDEFHGVGWTVAKTGGNYVLSFMSGSIQGEEKSVQISKQDFDSARIGEITFDQLCAKYGVY